MAIQPCDQKNDKKKKERKEKKEKPLHLAWEQLPSFGQVPGPRKAAAVGIFHKRFGKGKQLIQFGGQQECFGILPNPPVPNTCSTPEMPLDTCENINYNDVHSYDFETGEWKDITADIQPDPEFGVPTPRVFMAYATYENVEYYWCGKHKHRHITQWLLIYGGASFQGTFNCLVLNSVQQFGDFWALDVRNKKWISLSREGEPNTPGVLTNAALGVVKNRAYLFGGNPLNDNLWQFNLKNKGPWHLIPPNGIRPTARFNVVFVYNPDKDKLYLQNGDTAGGPNQTSSNELWSYDPKTNTWKLLQEFAGFGRKEFGAYGSKGNMFVTAFGQDENRSIAGNAIINGEETNIPIAGDQGSNEIFAINLKTKKTHSGWEQLFPVKNATPLRDISSTQDNKYLYVLNGFQYIVIGSLEGPVTPNIQLVYNRTIWRIKLKDIERAVELGGAGDRKKHDKKKRKNNIVDQISSINLNDNNLVDQEFDTEDESIYYVYEE